MSQSFAQSPNASAQGDGALDPQSLRAKADGEASRFPPLLAQAEHLAGTVLLGDHGRRRAGQGDAFWQYRAMMPGDSLRQVDWRRSARSDETYVSEREWQVAQSVQLWVDQGASMHFRSGKALPQKADRARLLTLALAILLIRGGERVGFTGLTLPPRRGEAQLTRMAQALSVQDDQDFAPPEARGLIPHARAVFVSDFLGDPTAVESALTKAADRGLRGALIQVLDPAEEGFPFAGRTIFESMGGTVAHETLKASELRDRYLQRLAERKDRLQSLCRLTGWQFMTHHTDQSAQSALLWLYRALDRSPA